MATRNMHEESRQKSMKESYVKLKESLTKDTDTHVKNYHLLMVLKEMEQKIEDQKEEIDGYKSFFSTLKGFLPKSFSSSTLLR